MVLFFVRVLIHGIKNAVITPWLGNRRSHATGSLVMILVVLILTYILVGTQGVTTTPGQLITVGLLWSSLTVTADILILKFLFRKELSDIFYNYTLHSGRLHSLVILSMFLAPIVLGHIVK